ncbi:2996_t:CDS:2 [Paraglomus brasilianum]|uniref:2996_t:CDS:1 n=1 Tax=Paraglomus brasilianum TaxID=144538 RepID=A0A9N9BWV4_9GLOM|nr:2996_t:CDS:2 [Paraglomus brasilianum]
MACFNLTILWRNRGNFNDKCVEKVQELNGTAYNPGTHWLSGPFKRQFGPGTGAGTGSGTTPGSGAGTGGGTTPGSGAGTGGGTTPGSGAGTGSGTTPGSGAGTGSGTTPGSGAGTGNGTTTPGGDSELQSVTDEVRDACKHAVLGFLIFATVLEAVMILWTFYFSSIISRYAEQLQNQSKTYPHHRLKSEITSTKRAIPAVSSTISRSSTSSDASNDNDEKRNPRTDL